MMRENQFQSNLKKEIYKMFPGCFIFRPDPTEVQGICDLLIIYKDKWAALECKRSNNAHLQNNQTYYVNLLNEMSFCRFIEPSNKEEVLHELQCAFGSSR